MYMYRIRLNPKKRKTAIALENPNLFHGYFKAHFEEVPLFRVDKVGSNYHMLVLADVPNIDFDEFISQFGYAKDSAEYKDYSKVLNAIEKDKRYRFRLYASPTFGIDGKKFSCTTYDRLAPWLARKAQDCGFKTTESAVLMTKKEQGFRHGKDFMTIKSVIFEGILTVEDKDKFKHALITGIGSRKSYGMGMLTVAPIID